MTNGRTWKLEAVLRVAFPCLSEAGSQRDLWEAAGLQPWDEEVGGAQSGQGALWWLSCPRAGQGRA